MENSDNSFDNIADLFKTRSDIKYLNSAILTYPINSMPKCHSLALACNLFGE